MARVKLITDPAQGRTKQDQKHKTDINRIVARFMSSPDRMIPANPGSYGDFSNVGDYFDAQLRITQARQMFDLLPARIRARFDDEPGELLRFILNPANREEAIHLGLVQSHGPEDPAPTGDETPAPPLVTPPEGDPTA